MSEKDWRSWHRNECMKITVIMRLTSGATMVIGNLPLNTRLIDLKTKVFQWVSEKASAGGNACDIEIDLVYGDKVMNCGKTTLGERGIVNEAAFLIVCKEDLPPSLISSSSEEGSPLRDVVSHTSSSSDDE